MRQGESEREREMDPWVLVERKRAGFEIALRQVCQSVSIE